MTRQLPVKHLMVLVDGTDASCRAVDQAIEMACLLPARLTALALAETDTLRQLLSARILTPDEMAEFEEGLRDSARRQLDEVRERASGKGIEIETLFADGNSEVVLPAEVRARAVDLVVVGYFDSSHAQRDLLDRQRQQVVDHAPCPVLVAR